MSFKHQEKLGVECPSPCNEMSIPELKNGDSKKSPSRVSPLRITSVETNEGCIIANTQGIEAQDRGDQQNDGRKVVSKFS